MSKSDAILLFAAIMVGLDAIANMFMLLYAPKWEKVKKKEIDQIKEQNRELKKFVSDLLGEVYE